MPKRTTRVKPNGKNVADVIKKAKAPSKVETTSDENAAIQKKTSRRKSSMVKFREDTIKYSRIVEPLTANKTMHRVFKKHLEDYLTKYPIDKYDMGTYKLTKVRKFTFRVQISEPALKIIKATHWSYLERLLAEASKITCSRGEKKTNSNDLSSAISTLPQNYTYQHQSFSF